jgi:hypothetical protein
MQGDIIKQDLTVFCDGEEEEEEEEEEEDNRFVNEWVFHF